MLAWFSDPIHLRPALFVGGLAVLLLSERAWPRRHTPMRRSLRWPANFALLLVDIGAGLALPLALLGAAQLAQARGWGLFNQLQMPGWIAGALSIAALDCAVYWQHRTLHVVPVLWRLHRVHHSDIEFDTTTALRFHPVEILLSLLWKGLVVVALGAPPPAVLTFEIALNAFAMFNHANLNLAADGLLRRVVVTPDMHRVHHSTWRRETDSNYGTILSLWDRVFGSYTPKGRESQESMRIGLVEFRELASQKIFPLLLQPMRQVLPESPQD